MRLLLLSRWLNCNRTWTAVLVAFVLLAAAPVGHSQSMDRLSKPPFFKTFKRGTTPSEGGVLYSVVGLDRITTTEFCYQGREQFLEPFLQSLNEHLAATVDSDLDRELPGAKGSPSLFVGSVEAPGAPGGAEMLRGDHEKYAPMMIFVKRPSKAWKAELSRRLSSSDAEHAVLVWLGFSLYPKADRGRFNKKVVLGTGYERDIRFFSAEDKPVEVLQLTGMLLDRDGNVLRAGAEGIIFEDTPFWAQALEIHKSIDDEAIRRLLEEERREEMPGKPLTWQVALDKLLGHLLGS